MRRSCALNSSNIFTRSALVENRGSGWRGPKPSNSSRVNIRMPKPGSWATCVASSPSVRDFVCGRQSLLPLGTRSSMRRVVASSDSRSGNRSACGLSCLLDLAVDFRAGFPVGFLDLLDFLDDLERADALGIVGILMRRLFG